MAVDLLSGLTTQEPLPAPDRDSRERDLLAWGGGAATLEAPGAAALSATARLTLWTVNMPPAWKYGLTAPGAAACLDPAGDGLTAAGGDDHVVRLWRGPEPVWSAGRSADLYQTDIERLSPFVWWDMSGFGAPVPDAYTNRNQNHTTMFLVGGGMRKEFADSDDAYVEQGAGRAAPSPDAFPGARRRAAVFLEEKKGDRYTFSFQSLLIDAEPGRIVHVRREARRIEPPRLLPDENTHNVADASYYGGWSFPGGGSAFLVDGGADDPAVLYDLDGRPLHAFPPHGPGRVLAAAPNRRLAIAAGEADGPRTTIEVWSQSDGKRLGSLGAYDLGPETADAKSPTTFQFSPSGRWLLAVRRPERQVDVWEIAKRERVAAVDLPGERARLLFDPDERRLLAVGPSYRGELPPVGRAIDPPFGRLFELPSGPKKCDLKSLDDLGCFADDAFRFTAHGVASVIVGDLGPAPFQLCLWDEATGERTLLRHAAPESAGADEWELQGGLVQLSPDRGRVLLTSSWQKRGQFDTQTYLQLWDLDGKKLMLESLEKGPGVLDLRLAPLNDAVYFSYDGGRVLKPHVYNGWRWADGDPRHTNEPLMLLHADDSQRWSLWRSDEGVFLYHAATHRKFSLEQSQGAWEYRASNPGGRYFVLGEDRDVKGDDGAVRREYRSALWDASSGAVRITFPPGRLFFAFDPAGRYVAAADPAAGEVRVWDVQSGQPAGALESVPLPKDAGEALDLVHGHTSQGWMDTSRTEPVSLTVHPDGRHLALLSQGVLQLWDVQEKRPVRTVPKPGHFTPVRCVAQNVKAGTVASGGDDGVILLWDRKDGRWRDALRGHTGPITALAYSPDGAYLASASADGTLAVWTGDGRRLWSRPAEGGAVFRSLAFHPNSGVLAAGAGDGRVVLIDVARQAVLARADTDGSAVQTLTFDRSGDRLAGGTAGGRIQVWRGDSLAPVGGCMNDSPVNALAFLDRLGLLATGGRTLRFWEADGGREVFSVEVPAGPVRALAPNTAGDELTVADQGSAPRTLDLNVLRQELERLRLPLPQPAGGAP